MDKRKLVESLIDDLSMMLKRKFDSLEYDKQYRRIVGHERDPMLKYMEIQFAAGAIFTGVYFAKCGFENPEIRLNQSLMDIVPVANKKIIGFELQSNQVMGSFEKLTSSGAYMYAVDSIPEWRNAPMSVKKSMAARINSLTCLADAMAKSLDNDLGKKIELGSLFNDEFDAFRLRFDAFLDQVYGAYVPPPQSKKGFWSSLFG